MKNPFASFFRSMLERTGRPRRVPAGPALSPEQFRELLSEALDDPATARLLARRLLGPVLPVAGAADPTVTTDAGTTGYVPYFFNDNGRVENSVAFQTGGKVGIGTTGPTQALHVVGNIKATQSLILGWGYDVQWSDTSTRIVGTSGATGYLSFLTNSAARMRIDPDGNVGIGTQTPQEKLALGPGSNFGTEMAKPGAPTLTAGSSGSLASGTYYYKITALDGAGGETAGGTEASVIVTGPNGSVSVSWTAITGAASYRIYRGTTMGGEDSYNTSPTNSYTDTGGGTPGTPPTVTTAMVVKVAASGNSWLLGGNVGIGTTNPDNKLHVMDGNIAIEAAGGAGKLKFRDSNNHTTRNEIYRDTADFTVLRNLNQVYTNLKIWAPTGAVGNDREATVALVRGDHDEEFMDLYNNAYGDSSRWHFGIRIQKRTTYGGEYRDFDFEQYNGNHDGPDDSPIYWPIMSLKADRTVHLQSHADTNSWTDTASIHATAAVKTTSSGAIAIATIPLSASRTYQIVVRVVARETGANPDYAFLYRAALAYREGGGPTIVGSDNVMPAITSPGASGWACTFAVSGNNIEVRVQSGADITVYWAATIEYQSVSTDS
jgi:hypothetical protein